MNRWRIKSIALAILLLASIQADAKLENSCLTQDGNSTRENSANKQEKVTLTILHGELSTFLTTGVLKGFRPRMNHQAMMEAIDLQAKDGTEKLLNFQRLMS